MINEYKYDFFKNKKQLKTEALQSIQHGWGILVGITAFSLLLLLLPIVPLFFVKNLYVTIGLLVFEGILFFELIYGNTYVHLKVARDENVKLKDLFVFAKPKTFFRVLLLTLRNLIIIALFSVGIVPIILFVKLSTWLVVLLCVVASIPGIIVMLRYLLINFILVDNPTAKFSEIFDINKRLIDEKLFDYIKLELDYIPLFLLSVITACVGFMWSIPYFGTINAKFYLDLK